MIVSQRIATTHKPVRPAPTHPVLVLGAELALATGTKRSSEPWITRVGASMSRTLPEASKLAPAPACRR